MKERPILFSAPMVRAILEGKKTQTRRIIKPQPPNEAHPFFIMCSSHKKDEGKWRFTANKDHLSGTVLGPIECPYGKPGNLLWVREAWAVQHEYDAFAPSEIGSSARWHYAATEYLGDLRKRPSILLPRRGSRITLEITDVRVDRLQQISEDDAIAEGVTPTMPIYGDCGGFEHQGGRDAFWRLWESIHGTDSWNANPWVWVMKFRRTEVRQ